MGVRQEGIRRISREGELQDLHAAEAVAIAQRLDLRGRRAEILGDDRERIADGAAQRLEERATRAGAPRPVDRRRRPGRDVPGAGEADEVVDADEVDLGEHPAQAIDPPAEPVGGHGLPAVERIAPELSGRAEIVGRDAGDVRRGTLVVEEELPRVGPGVATVVGDEDRQVADNPDA